MADLTDQGYTVEWDCLPAAAFGAPHLRDRVFVVAHRRPEPYVFGPVVDLFRSSWETLPSSRSGEHRRWPRAGSVTVDGLAVHEPLAGVADVKAGRVLWPTPSAGLHNYDEDPDQWLARRERLKAKGINGNGAGMPLGIAVKLLPTPTASDYKGPGPLDRRAPGDDNLPTRIARLWPTPRASANEWRSTRAAPSHGVGHGRVLAGEVCDAERAEGRGVPPGSDGAGALNPDWVEWLMGFPVGWTDPDATDLTLHPWPEEPDGIPRTAPNVAGRKHRLKALGNALVPPAAEWVAARALHGEA